MTDGSSANTRFHIGSIIIKRGSDRRQTESKDMLRSILSSIPISMPALSFRLQAPVAASSPYHLSTYEHVPGSDPRPHLDRKQNPREPADPNPSRLVRSHIGVGPEHESDVDAAHFWACGLIATSHRVIGMTKALNKRLLHTNTLIGDTEQEDPSTRVSAPNFGIEPNDITSPCPSSQVAVRVDVPVPSSSASSRKKKKSILGTSRNEKGRTKSVRKPSICIASDPSLEQRQVLASTSDLDTPLLLSDLKSLQSLVDSNKGIDISESALRFWRQWHTFLMSSKGKTVKPDMLHNISHAFFFLYYSRLPDLFSDIQTQEKSGIHFEGRTIRSLGFASIKAQHWCILNWGLKHLELPIHDLIILLKATCRKLAFSTWESRSSRIDVIIDIAKLIGLRMEDDLDFAEQAGSAVEHIARTLFKMQCIDPVVPYVLQILERHPGSVNSFSAAFLHQVMNTCASHQHLHQAHQLLAAIPPSLQTLDHYKACFTVWDRRTPRPVIRAASLLWNTLQSHSHLKPDIETYNLYLSLRSRLGHVKDVSDIIKRMTRTGPAPNQRTREIFLHSVGQRHDTESAWNTFRHWPSENCTPNSRIANILLSSKIRHDRTASGPIGPIINLPVVEEVNFVEMMERVKSFDFGTDEVTRNIVVKKFLARSHSHSPQQIWALKELVLPITSDDLINSNDKQCTRKEFRRFKRPLYSMLWSAFIRAGQKVDAARLVEEWERERRLARMRDAKHIPKPKAD